MANVDLTPIPTHMLYTELRRRGHYDVFEVGVSDIQSTDVYEWAKEAGKVGELMDEWSGRLIDDMDPGDQLYDTLYEAARELGYELD